MATLNIPDEYSTLLRLTLPHPSYAAPTHIPAGYSFIPDLPGSRPLTARQYCRETTLNRGRILYEVWNSSQTLIAGYIVPSDILAEAKAYRPESSLHADLKHHERRAREVLRHVRGMVFDMFPNAPPHVAKSVVEDFSERRNAAGFKKVEVESAVVRHVREKWTSYSFRTEFAGESEVVAQKAVRVRMREVLASWLGLDEKLDRKAWMLWEQWGLLSEEERAEVVRGKRVKWFSGGEIGGVCI